MSEPKLVRGAEPEPARLGKTGLVHPAEHKPGLPTDSKPARLANPEPAHPAEPELAHPAEPEPSLPTEPEPRCQVEPDSGLAAQPELGLAAQPEPALPVEPEPARPAEPKPAFSAELKPALSSEPEPARPVEPEPALPTEPEPALPTEFKPVHLVEPEPALPAEPESALSTAFQPAHPAEPEPALPTELEPVGPAKPAPAVPAESELIRPAEPEPAFQTEPEPIYQAEPEPTPPAESEIRPAEAEVEPALPVEPISSTESEPISTPESQPERVLPPALDLLNGNEYFEICVPLHNAALEGNWEAASKIIEDCPRNILSNAIARGGSTILHVAAGARKLTFVEKLLNSVKQTDDLISELLLQCDDRGNNAFCLAAATGDVEIAKLMLKNKPGLQKVCGFGNMTPLYLAVRFGQKDMANFLYPRTVDSLNLNELEDLFIESVNSDLYGIALKLLNDWVRSNRIQEIWVRQAEAQGKSEIGTGEMALRLLGQKPNLKIDDALTLVNLLWKSLIDSQTSNQVQGLIRRSRNMLFDAAELGNFEFIEVAVRFYPDLIYEINDDGLSMFHLAVRHRHVDIIGLINMMGFHKDLLINVDNDGDNILHLAAKYPHPPPAKIVPGAALEMQREILMFEEVQRIFQPWYRERKNEISQRKKRHGCKSTKGRKDYASIFTKTHKDLRERGENWMRSTAKSCMLVATLIATVVFAAAFAVPGGNHQDTSPGGNDQETGKPIFLQKKLFKVFVASDAIALFSSSISILMFLSILTSRYEEKDFRMRLPLKLMAGLLALFISVIAMTVAFSSAIFLIYSERWNWITGPSFALSLVAASLYLVLHFSLLKDVISSTFCFRHSTFFSRNQIKKRSLPV